MYLLRCGASEFEARTGVFEDQISAIFIFIMAANKNLDELTD